LQFVTGITAGGEMNGQVATMLWTSVFCMWPIWFIEGGLMTILRLPITSSAAGTQLGKPV